MLQYLPTKYKHFKIQYLKKGNTQNADCIHTFPEKKTE